jgi:hypothetical protein
MKKNINNEQTNYGIPYYSNIYLEVNSNQNKNEEYEKITNFLKDFISYYSKKYNLNKYNLKIKFINYGKTELVYILLNNNIPIETILVKQPNLELGTIKQEVNNLKELNINHNNIITPSNYYTKNNQELYTTPYIDKAHCIASYYDWGVYKPNPKYHFKSFTKEEEKLVTTAMIGILVSLFDKDNNQGISSCKLGGGDFILPKDWENTPLTEEYLLNNMILIAARSKVNCSFDYYIDLIKDEFGRRTIDENINYLILNHRGRVPIKKEYINDGINLGIKLQEENKVYKKTRF